MTTQIKRLFQSNKDFVPITLAEAVVVNTTNIEGLKPLGITTLDKVLRTTLGAIGTNATNIATAVNNINTALEGKLDKLKAGAGINISSDGTISVTTSIELYRIVTKLPDPSESITNTIYLVPLSEEGATAGNRFAEFICVPQNLSSIDEYIWEKIGEIQTDVDLSGYVTTDEFNTLKNATITALDVTLSNGSDKVLVDYTIPSDLYDDMVNVDTSDNIIK